METGADFFKNLPRARQPEKREVTCAMPGAPAFLVGVGAGFSAAAIARVVADAELNPKGSKKSKGAKAGDAKRQRKGPLMVKPKPFVRKEYPADDPCAECCGSGRVDCSECKGRGRTNLTELVMLPMDTWPEWCQYCRGSGLIYCSRCSGLGKHRAKIGFDLED